MMQKSLPDLMLEKLVSRDKNSELISTGEAFSWVRLFKDPVAVEDSSCYDRFISAGVEAKHRKSRSGIKVGDDYAESRFVKAKNDPELGVYYSLVGALALHKKSDAGTVENFSRNTGFQAQQTTTVLTILSQKAETMREISLIQRLEDTLDIVCSDDREKRPAEERISAIKAAKRIFRPV